jgi:hypothetical protein
MIQVFYLLIFLGFIQSSRYSSGQSGIPGRTSEYIITDICESLQNHDAILEDEDYMPDFGSFCQIANPDLSITYTDITSDLSFKCIIYTRHLNLPFISDLPPPCCFIL